MCDIQSGTTLPKNPSCSGSCPAWRGWDALLVYNLQRADLGFPAERLALVRVDPRAAGDEPARRENVLRELISQIQRISGVPATSFSQLGLFTGGKPSATIDVEGYVPKGENDRDRATDVVGPGYVSTLGVPLRLGRDILESDRGNAPRVCVINEAFARRFFNHRNPVGLRITPVEDDGPRSSYLVVGVAGNARTGALRGDVEPRYFVAGIQDLPSVKSPTFLIRTATDPSSVIATVRKTIERIDFALPVMSAKSIDERLAPLIAQDRATARLIATFGGVALTLAAIGLYGVLSYSTARRTSEIAIRIAFGARAAHVQSMIRGETVASVAAGLATGSGLALAGSRLIESRLYGIAPQDALTLALATALLLAVALGAAYVPAHRASKLDPMTALRR